MLTAHDLGLFLLLTVAAFAPPGCASQGAGKFVARAVTAGDATYPYQVYLPDKWNGEQKWPIILYLHGAGERGDDNTAQTRVGLGPALRQQDLAAVVVMPQCPRGRWWPEAEMQAQAVKALDQAISEFNGDPERIYLTGISMGGYGTWAIARSHPGKFAALAPVCGGVRAPRNVPVPPVLADRSTDDPYKAVAEKVGVTPAWIFHGSADTVVPVEESRKMVEALKAVGGRVRYSEYEAVGHNSWDRAYQEADFFPWLLSQRLPASARSSLKTRQRN